MFDVPVTEAICVAHDADALSIIHVDFNCEIDAICLCSCCAANDNAASRTSGGGDYMKGSEMRRGGRKTTSRRGTTGLELQHREVSGK